MKGGLKSGQRKVLETKVLQPLREGYDRLTKTEKKLAGYLLSRPDCLVLETAATIAGNVGVSPMTVGRFLRKLGFDGLSDMRHQLKADLYGPGRRQPVVDRPPLPGLHAAREGAFQPAGQPGCGARRDPPGL